LEMRKNVKEIVEKVHKQVLSEIKGTGYGQESGSLASMIDHTLLKPDATAEQIKKLCREAREYKFASVCVNTSYVPLTVEMLRGSGVKTCCVVGFPLGACTTKAKVAETKEAIGNGATEIDMVVNVGALKSGNWDFVKDDIESIVIVVKDKALVKVIIETCLLNDGEKMKVCQIAKMVGADFVKTSTGFSTGGAKVEDIRLMRHVVGPNFGVKASGGIRDYETAMAMVRAGANRLGTSSGIAIVKNEKPGAL
jgi:deoxyribose-phosphate aldolase